MVEIFKSHPPAQHQAKVHYLLTDLMSSAIKGFCGFPPSKRLLSNGWLAAIGQAQTSNSIFPVPLFCSFNLPLHVDEIVVRAMDKGLTVNASSGRFIQASHMHQTSKIFLLLTSPKAPNHPTHSALSGSNHRVFEGAHPNLKLLKFGFRRVVLLHVLEWSHNSHILTLSPSVFRKKKHGYVFFSPFCFRLSSCRYFRVSPFLQLVWNSFELWEGSWDRLY